MEKKTLLSIILVIFTIGCISFFSRQSTDQDTVLLLPGLEEVLEEVNLISFQSSQPESLLTIKKEPEGWIVIEAGGYPADLDKLFGFFVGQVMKLSGGKANPQLTNEILKKLLKG